MLNFDRRLEHGSYDSSWLQLMNRGIDRSIALDLDILESDDEDEPRLSLYKRLYDRCTISTLSTDERQGTGRGKDQRWIYCHCRHKG